ncbi:MAG: putative TIM-barrel fold metal-dependent hydrolase [Planctomycetota bacterium]|jgi:predicted TIM-barrel fold metal-dependent hydrolase
MGSIDFHSHFFSRTFFETLAGQSSQPGDTGSRLANVTARTGLELPAPSTAEHLARWIAELDQHDVEHLVSFASVPEEAPVLAEAARLAKGRITPMALVNLTAPGAADMIRGRLDEGFGGVLTFPAMHRYHIADEACAPALAVLEEANALCYVHCGILVVKLRDLLGLPRPYDMAYASPLSLVPAANAHRGINFVIPHFGAGFLRETLMLGAQCDNVYVDSSSSNGWMKTQPVPTTLKDVFERAIGAFGHERVLFGTDSGTFPAGWQVERFKEQSNVLWDLGLTASEQAAVLSENARRLLKL